MKKRMLSILPLVLSLATASAAPGNGSGETGPGQPLREPFTVVCLGDSITRAGYPAELEKMLSIRVINAGVNGNTSRQGLGRLERDVVAHRPDAVIVFFGANDSRQDAPKIHVPVKEYEANLTKIIERCQRIGAKVVLGTPPPIDPEPYYQRHPKEYYQAVGGLEAWLAKYRAAALRVAEAKEVPVVDLNQLLAKEPAWRKPDGVHPTEEGNRIIARLFSKPLEPFLKLALGIPVPGPAAEPPGKVGVYCRLTDVRQPPEKLPATMRQIKNAGIDFILPYAKGTSGKVKWHSQVAPPELIDDPDFMGVVVREAHAAGLKVYPVFCVATEGGDKSTNAVLGRHPSWAFVCHGERIGYIDPGQPAARKYEVDLILELVTRYQVDGLSLDYMRAPNAVGYTDTGRAAFLGRRQVDLARVAGGAPAALGTEHGKKTGTRPADAREHPVWPEWKEWKREQLNEFMREIRAAVNRAKPGLPISTYCWGAHTYTGKFETCQDWKTWIKEGSIDWINPSGYRYTDEEFQRAAALNRQNVPQGFPFYVTIGVATSHGKLPDTVAIERQLNFSRQAGADGVVLFTWEALTRFLPEAGEAIERWKKKGG